MLRAGTNSQHSRSLSSSSTSTSYTTESNDASNTSITSGQEGSLTQLPSPPSGEVSPTDNLAEAQQNHSLVYTLVNDEETLREFLIDMDKVQEYKLDHYMDEEGSKQHDRYNHLNGIALKMVSIDRTWLLDPRALGDKLFHTAGTVGKKRTFGDILQSTVIPKALFDGTAGLRLAIRQLWHPHWCSC